MRLPFFRSRKSEGFLQKKLQDGCYVAGWARNIKEPEKKLQIDIYDGERLLGTTQADIPRKDLKALGKEDGHYGFSFKLPEDIFDGKEHTIRAVVVEFGEKLRHAITMTLDRQQKSLPTPEGKPAGKAASSSASKPLASKPLVAEMYLDGVPCGIRRLEPVESAPGCGSTEYQVEHLITSLGDGATSGRLKLIVREARADDFTQLAKRYVGACEPVTGSFVRGWAHDKENAQASLLLEMLIDGCVLSTFRADKFRANLAREGIGTGYHGFLAELPEQFFDGKDHELAIRVAGTDIQIRNSPIKITARQLRNFLLAKIEKRLLALDAAET